jgi:hypothetical protein
VLAWQIWKLILEKLDMLSFTSQGSNIFFSGWWCGTIKGVPRGSHKGFNSLVILVALLGIMESPKCLRFLRC